MVIKANVPGEAESEGQNMMFFEHRYPFPRESDHLTRHNLVFMLVPAAGITTCKARLRSSNENQ